MSRARSEAAGNSAGEERERSDEVDLGGLGKRTRASRRSGSCQMQSRSGSGGRRDDGVNRACADPRQGLNAGDAKTGGTCLLSRTHRLTQPSRTKAMRPTETQ